ncbi:MAG TPA: hypothetical protein DCY27_02930 [Desulfobacterales bacterium]|nr:hypothetical protein [Desulfobacterales bacterium]
MFNAKKIFCPACGGRNIGPWLKKEKSGIIYNIWKCSGCKTGFMNPQPTKEFLDSVYSFSGHGLMEPISYSEVLKREKEYPNATVDAERLVSWAKNYMGGGKK